MTEPVISAQGLRKEYGDFVAVDGIDFEVHPGESFGLLGPNGAGKSTTMRMIGGTLDRSAGELTVLGLDPDEQGPDDGDEGAPGDADELGGQLGVRDGPRLGRHLSHHQVQERHDDQRQQERDDVGRPQGQAPAGEHGGEPVVHGWLGDRTQGECRQGDPELRTEVRRIERRVPAELHVVVEEAAR